MTTKSMISIKNTADSSSFTLKRTKEALKVLDEIFDLADYLPAKEDDFFIKDGGYFIFTKKLIYVILRKGKKAQAKKNQMLKHFDFQLKH